MTTLQQHNAVGSLTRVLSYSLRVPVRPALGLLGGIEARLGALTTKDTYREPEFRAHSPFAMREAIWKYVEWNLNALRTTQTNGNTEIPRTTEEILRMFELLVVREGLNCKIRSQC